MHDTVASREIMAAHASQGTGKLKLSALGLLPPGTLVTPWGGDWLVRGNGCVIANGPEMAHLVLWSTLPLGHEDHRLVQPREQLALWDRCFLEPLWVPP